MKKYTFLLIAAITFLASACTQIGNDPEKDGRDMMNQCIAELKEGNTDKASEIVEKYVKVYKEKPIHDKLTFAKAGSGAMWDAMIEAGATEWAKFAEQIKPVLEEFSNLQNSTESEDATGE